MRLATGLSQDHFIADFSKSALKCQADLRSYLCLKYSQCVFTLIIGLYKKVRLENQ